MQVSILGRLIVTEAGDQIPVPRAKERALLTLLAAEAGSTVSTDRLIDGLWGESPPATATKTLQNYVHHLRSLLPENAIATDDGGYRLALDPMDVDAHRFAADVAAARDTMDHDPAAAGEALQAALATWRGVPFLDAENADRLVPARTRLEAIRLQALADSNDALIRTGREEEALPELRSLLDEHPMREDLWALYMLGLYRTGRQAEALRAFSEVRRLLAEELGIEPGPELRRLEGQILQQDESIYVSPQGTGPDAQEDADDARDHVPRFEEKRLVTLVLAEMTGMPEVIDAIGEERATLVASETRVALTAVFEQLGGTIAHQSDTSLVAIFGAPVARETDTSRAIHAALRVISQMDGWAREVQESWGVASLGIKCGVQSRSLTVPFSTQVELGESVAELAEMISSEAPGVVLVDDHTRALMGDLFTWDQAEPGGGASRVRGVERSPDKARIGRRLSAPLTGRAGEKAALEAMLASLSRGIGGVMVIRGEAGVGKTRLVSEVQDSPNSADIIWLIGHCAAFAEASPYWPIRDLLRSWLDLGIDFTDLQARVALHHRIAELDTAQPDVLYPYLGRILGVVLEPDQQRRLELAPESLQYRTFEVVGTLLESIAASAPAILVIEDVHWSDPTSIQLLERLLSLTERSALLIILTTRPDPGHVSNSLIEAARQVVPHLTRDVQLGPLSEEDQTAMLNELIGSTTMPRDAAGRILELAEGNPFYLEELVGSLIDRGTLTETPNGWAYDITAGLTVPETVEKVVQARIDRLDIDPHVLMTAASVLGRSFGLPLLQGIAGDDVNVMEAIQKLLRLDLLVEAQRWPHAEYVFKHALIQEASYRALTHERRVSMHLRAARWLESHYEGRRDEVAGVLARHWLAAGDEEQAAEALLRAGDLARRNHALAEAIDHYQQLLALLERRGDQRAMALVLLKLALTQHTSLRFAESNATYRRAFEFWDPPPSPPATATLRYRSSPWFDIPDPVRSYSLQDIQLQMALFDRLVERWPDDTIVPSLAENWEIADDGLRYLFTLRAGLTWSDGQPLTAHDVEFGFKRNLDPERPGISSGMLHVLEGALDYVKGSGDAAAVGARALDDRRIEFRLLAPAPYFLGMLNRPDCGPQPRHAIDRFGDSWGEVANEVVSGVFHRTSQTNDSVRLERRASYRGARLGNVGIVEWHVGPQGEVASAFERGNADLLWALGSWDGSVLDRLDPESVMLHPHAGLLFLAFNHRNPAVSDPRFRRALAHGIDRVAMREMLPAHTTPATGGVVPPALAGHTPDIVPPFDPDAGRQLLAATGVPSRVRLLAADLPGYLYQPLASISVEMWREHLGLEAELTVIGRNEFFSLDHVPSEFHGHPSWWYPGYIDAEYFLRLLLHSDGPDNLGGFSDRRFDELIERAVREPDERARLELFHKADRMAVRDLAAVIPLAYTRQFSLIRDGITGWWEFGKSWANFADLTIDVPD